MDISGLSGFNLDLIKQKKQLPMAIENLKSSQLKITNKNPLKDDKLYQTALEFESLIVKQMLSAMKKTVQKTGLLDGGLGGEFFDDMLYDNYAKDISKNSSFGLADSVYRELTRISEIKNNSSKI